MGRDMDIPTKRVTAEITYEVRLEDFTSGEEEAMLLSYAVRAELDPLDVDVKVIDITDSSHRYDPEVES